MAPHPEPVGPGRPLRRWTIVIESPEGVASEVALELDSYLIGRDPSCALCLPAREVSKRHARLARDGEGAWWLHDEGSTGGTFLNGVRLAAPAVLAVDDVAHVGPFRLQVRGTGAPARRKLLPPKEQRLVPSPARLRLYDGPMAGREVRLDRGLVRLGTGADATVLLDRKLFQRVRVEVRPRAEGGFEVEDRSAEASLRVNGRVVSAARLGAQSDDVMLLLGPVEAVGQDPAQGFRVRYLASERLEGDVTPAPVAGRPGAAGMPGEDTEQDGPPGWGPAEAETYGGETWPLRSLPPPPVDEVGAVPSSSPVTPPRDTERTAPSSSPATPVRDTERTGAGSPPSSSATRRDAERTATPSSPATPVREPLTSGPGSERTPVDGSIPALAAGRPAPAVAAPSWPTVEAASAWLDGGAAPAREARAEAAVAPAPAVRARGASSRPAASEPSARAEPAGPAAAERAAPRPPSRRSGAVVAGVLVLGAVLAAVWWLTWPGPEEPGRGARPVASASAGPARPVPPSAPGPERVAASATAVRAPAGGAAAAAESGTAGPRAPAASTEKTPAARASAVRPRGVPSAAPGPKEESGAGERDASADDQQEAQRKRLEAKLAAGKASQSELKALWDLCLRQRDVACSGRVEAALRNSHEQP